MYVWEVWGKIAMAMGRALLPAKNAAPTSCTCSFLKITIQINNYSDTYIVSSSGSLEKITTPSQAVQRKVGTP